MIQPLKWHGGKFYLAQRLLARMPKHTHYAEPFAGGLAVLLQKPCDGISETVNDLDGQLSNFWQVLADPLLFDQFYRRVEALPLSQKLFDAAADHANRQLEDSASSPNQLGNFPSSPDPAEPEAVRKYREQLRESRSSPDQLSQSDSSPNQLCTVHSSTGPVEPEAESPLCYAATDPVQRAVQFFIRARQSRQGLRRDYCTPTTRTRRGMNEQVSAWLTAVAGLPQVANRLRRVEVRCMPAVDFIRRYDHAGCLLYVDPPYVHTTRQHRSAYTVEMTDQQHAELLELLAQIKGKFLLSGYPNELYSSFAAKHGWRCVQFQIDNKASAAKQKPVKTECAWMNY